MTLCTAKKLQKCDFTEYEQKRDNGMRTACTCKSVTLTLVLHVARYISQVSTRRSYCRGNQLLTLLCAHSRTNSSALVATAQQPVARTLAHCRIRLLTALHLHSVPTCIYLLQHLQQQSQQHIYIYNWLKLHTSTDKLTVTYWHSKYTNFVLYWQLYSLTDQMQNATHRITILSVVMLVPNLVTGQGCSRFNYRERYLALEGTKLKQGG